MNIDEIKALYASGKLESFKKAADELHVSQPTVSMRIQCLEKEYSVSLFRRTSKGSQLTEEGKALYHYAEKLLRVVEEMDSCMKDFTLSPSGKFSIGATRLIATYLLPHIILDMKRINPKLKYNLFTGLSQEVLDQVINYQCHVGVVGRVHYPDNVIFRELYRPRMCFITIDDFGDKIPLNVLSDYPIILLEDGSATKEFIINEFTKRGIKLNKIVEARDPFSIKSMVQVGLGGSFFPLYSIKQDVMDGRFKFVELLDPIELHIDIIYLQKRRHLDAIKKFVTLSKRWISVHTSY